MPLVDLPASLIENARRGDRSATEELLRVVSPDIYRFIFSMVRDHDDTDEIVQESLVRLFRHIEKLKEPDRFAAWAMRIAANQVQTHRRRKGRRRLYELNEAIEPEEGSVVAGARPAPNPRDRAAQRQTRDLIEEEMGRLPDRQQTAIVLFEIQGCSVREIARVMECSEGAVKFNLHQARRKLRHRLGPILGDAAPTPQKKDSSAKLSERPAGRIR